MIHFQFSDYWSHDDGNVLVNTVNCWGVMGKGIAKDFRERFPDMFEAYRMACKSQKIQPGTVFRYDLPDGRIILNAATKNHWKEPSNEIFIRQVVRAIRYHLHDINSHTHPNVLLPALGCGNGGMCYNFVSGLIQHGLEGMPHHITVFNPPGYEEFNAVAP